MGSGKTSWAIQHMKEHRDKRYIYITPYLDEIKRIKKSCRWMNEPSDEGPFTKQGHFQQLLRDGKCIAATHELFKQCQITHSIVQNIQDHNYILILDEMIDPVEMINITEKDFKTLFTEHYVETEPQDDGTEIMRWIDDSYSGKFNDYRKKIESNTVVKYGDNVLIWLFPPELLKAFGQIYILTFLFKGSPLEQYLKIYDMSYQSAYIQKLADSGSYELVMGEQDISKQKAHIEGLINIYDGDLNKIGDDMNALNYTAWSNMPCRKKLQKKIPIENNALQFFENTGVPLSQFVWTRFKGNDKRKPALRGKYQNRFLSFNTRATNEWSDCTVLAYLVNVYLNPVIANWFDKHGGKLDERTHALSAMIQWIWRSAIRNDKPIQLYLPSMRMRDILKEWLSEGEGR